MQIKHYYEFKPDITQKMTSNSLNAENWDLLRNDDKETPFSIEKSVESYEQNCQSHSSNMYKQAAEIISAEINTHNLKDKKIISLGVGKAILEWHLKRINPSMRIECTDYTPQAIESLKKVFVNMDSAYTFDVINGDYTQFTQGGGVILLMCRISTEFSKRDWRKIFQKIYDAGIENLFYLPADFITFKDAIRSNLRRIIRQLQGIKYTFCGYHYSESEYYDMFCGNSKHKLFDIVSAAKWDNSKIFLLSRIN